MKNSMAYRFLKIAGLAIIVFLFSLNPQTANSAPQMVDYCYLPPFVTDPNTPPNIIIVFDRTTFGKNRAYQGSYKSTKSYYGFFDANASYTHNGTTFVKDNSCTPTAANSYNCFSGNVLNYALMSSLDLARKAFIGFGWTPVSSGAGDVYTYTGNLTSYGASNAQTATACDVSFAGGTYSYYFDIGNDGTGGTKASPVTITVNNNSTCPTSSSYAAIPVFKKDIAMSFTDENRIGIIEKYSDTNQDLKDDYPDASARFGMRRWKMGSGNDKATDIIDDGASITEQNKIDYFKSILNTTSSSPSNDPGDSPLGDMMHDIVHYFRNLPTTYSDSNTFTQSPYNWARDPAPCRKNFALFITAGADLSDTSPLSSSCTSGSYSTAFSQDACYGYTTDLSAVAGTQNIMTYVVHTASGITCKPDGKCSNNTDRTCTYDASSDADDKDCSNVEKLKYAASAGGGEYISVTDPATLESKIEEAILNIISTSASGSTVATLTTQTREAATLTQAYFYPRREGTQLRWIGYLRLLWSDQGANLREDTTNNAWLDLKLDKILSFYYDDVAVAYKAKTYADSDGDLKIDSCGSSVTKDNDNVLTIWDAQGKLLSRAPDDRNIKIGIDSDNDGIVEGSELNDFTTSLASTLQPYWNYASYCSDYTSRWCSQDSHCNYCNTLRTTYGVDRGCTSSDNCYYCDGNKTMVCSANLSCSDGSGACATASAACGIIGGVCVGDCYKYYGTCNTGGSLVCDVDGTTVCSGLGTACTVGGTTGTCKAKCTADASRLCTDNAGCIDDYRGGAPGSACVTDSCSIAAANTCQQECDSANCATSVIKFARGYDKPTTAGGDFRIRHDPEQSGSDITATLKLGDIVYSTPRISPNSAVNGYDVTYKDSTYKDFIQSTAIKDTTPIVIVGANDGMIHAFKVAKIKDIKPPTETGGGVTGGKQVTMFADNMTDTSPPIDLGKELWAYIPYNTVPFLKWYCSKSYCHIPMVDARFTVVDASINGDETSTRTSSSWRRLLIGAMGVGGKKIIVGNKTFSSSVFVLNITNPSSPTLLWERQLPDNTLTTSTPAIVRFSSKPAGGPAINDTENGVWYLVFGSGPESVTTNKVNYKTGNTKIFVFNLRDGSTPTGLPNGIDTGLSGVAFGDIMAVDMDSDYQIDDIYFGTYGGTGASQTGNFYRLRLRNDSSYYSDPSAWGSSMISKVVNVGRPIYAAPEIALDALGNIWLYFGTGLYLSLEHARATPDQEEWLYGVIETKACWDGSGSCSTLDSANFLDTSGISFTGAKAVELGCFCAGNLITKISCAPPGTCAGTCTSPEDTVVLSVVDAAISGSGVPDACSGEKDKDAIYCLANVINTSYNGWRRAITGQKSFSKPFVAGGLADFTSFEPTRTVCSLGGSTYLISLHYTTGTAYVQPTIYLAGGTSGATTSLTIKASVNLGIGVPPLGESLVALPLSGDTYKVITQVSGGLRGTTMSPSLPAKSGYVLWLVK